MTVITVVLIMASSVALGGALATTHAATVSSDDDEETNYNGSHVSFETTVDALVNHHVEGDSVVTDVAVESTSSAEQRGALGIGLGLAAVTDLDAAAISVDAQSDTQVALTTESGATIQAHDSQRGHLLINADGEGQLISANVTADAEAEQESEKRVVVTKDDGTQGTFIVIGDGEVTVNNEGNVTAELDHGSSLTYQQYAAGERDEADEDRERLIADGTAAAEVYVSMAAEGSQETAADVVQYSQETTVEVVSHSENEVELTAERTESEGRIIVTSVSEQAFDSAGDLEVSVDGEAAASVESMSELKAAADGGEQSAYMVRHASTTDASAEVLVALNHFSERHVTMHSDSQDGDEHSPADGDETRQTADSDDSPSVADDDGPGFTVFIAGMALLLLVLVGARRAL